MNTNIFLKKIRGPVHQLTKADIRNCIVHWNYNNNKALLFLSPYRWMRLFTEGKPRSIYELEQLVKSWGSFEASEYLSTADEKAIATIIDDRMIRGSHSSQDGNANSSAIFMALTQSQQITQHFPPIECPDTIDELCFLLNSLLSNKYKAYDGSARKAISAILTLSSNINYYSRELMRVPRIGDGDLLFYSDINFKSEDEVKTYLKRFLESFIEAVHFCFKHHLVANLFAKLNDPIMAPCIMGKLSLLYAFVDRMRNELSYECHNINDVMQLIINELEIDLSDENLTYEEVNERILQCYENKTINSFTITAPVVRDYLIDVLSLSDSQSEMDMGVL